MQSDAEKPELHTLYYRGEAEGPRRFLDFAKSHTMLAASVFAVLLVLIFLLFYVSTLNAPPKDFPLNEQFVVSQGETVKEIAQELNELGFIRSYYYARYMFKKEFGDAIIHAGAYTFGEPRTTGEIIQMLTDGATDESGTRVTFPEGFSTHDIMKYLPENLQTIDPTAFEDSEGFLFPDTYYLSDDETADSIIQKMHDNYEEKLAPLRSKIEASSLSEEEVITLASIVEKEANTPESMRTVAGILLKRLEIGMALQVDATFNYLLDKESHELTEEDLDIDSHYNTYKYPGLPPAPIANPGLTAIMAVLDPIETDYLYYLTGPDGSFHYAASFEDHKYNKTQFLQ